MILPRRMAAAPWRMRPAPVDGSCSSDLPHEVVDQFGGPLMQYQVQLGMSGTGTLKSLVQFSMSGHRH